MASFIKNMLGNGGDMEERLAAMADRIEQLEKAMGQQEKMIADIIGRLKDMEKKAAETKAACAEPAKAAAKTANATAESTNATADATIRQEPRTLYFSAPTPSGEFCDASATEVPGTSIYRLVTPDGVNGRFAMLNTTDAVATASISVSQFVKPACKIKAPFGGIPRRVTVHEEGTATMKDGVWKVTKKALVEFVG